MTSVAAPPKGGSRSGEAADVASRRAHRELIAFVAVSAALLAVHLVAALQVGFGDSEALYASYALHPQPAYLDHPGLVGLVAGLVGGGSSPSPERAHAVTSVLSALFPWAMALACRACGAPWRRSLAAGLVVALVPEVAVGMFAMTPDLLLALAWTACIALAAVALQAPAGSLRSTFAFAGAGLFAGVAATAKASGALLLLALAVTYSTKAAREHAKTVAPWAGLVAGGVALVPVVALEARSGWPMVRHRLVDTQAAAGSRFEISEPSSEGSSSTSRRSSSSWSSSPRSRRGSHVAIATAPANLTLPALLFTSFALPLAVLLPLCLWSRVAEPHWIAPALLVLAPVAARANVGPPRALVVASCALSACMVAAVHAWVLTPGLLGLAPASYDARVDIANELRGWPEAVHAVREEALAAWTPGSERGDLVVVGPHWVICAQLESQLRGEVPVGCDTPIRDDFDAWYPRNRWRRAETILWVSDSRFGPPPPLPAFTTDRVREVSIVRGGRTVRVFTVTILTRRARA